MPTGVSVVLGDKGYDSNKVRAQIEAAGAAPGFGTSQVAEARETAGTFALSADGFSPDTQQRVAEIRSEQAVGRATGAKEAADALGMDLRDTTSRSTKLDSAYGFGGGKRADDPSVVEAVAGSGNIRRSRQLGENQALTEQSEYEGGSSNPLDIAADDSLISTARGLAASSQSRQLADALGVPVQELMKASSGQASFFAKLDDPLIQGLIQSGAFSDDFISKLPENGAMFTVTYQDGEIGNLSFRADDGAQISQRISENYGSSVVTGASRHDDGGLTLGPAAVRENLFGSAPENTDFFEGFRHADNQADRETLIDGLTDMYSRVLTDNGWFTEEASGAFQRSVGLSGSGSVSTPPEKLGIFSASGGLSGEFRVGQSESSGIGRSFTVDRLRETAEEFVDGVLLDRGNGIASTNGDDPLSRVAAHTFKDRALDYYHTLERLAEDTTDRTLNPENLMFRTQQRPEEHNEKRSQSDD